MFEDAIYQLEEQEMLLWVGAVLFFGVGDMITTIVGLQFFPVVESGPLAAYVLSEYGMGLLFPLKFGTFALIGGMWAVVPRPHRVGGPLALVVLGILITAWNLAIISIAYVGLG